MLRLFNRTGGAWKTSFVRICSYFVGFMSRCPAPYDAARILTPAEEDHRRNVSNEEKVRTVVKRQDIALAMLAAADGRPYTPAQIQKALFLLDQNTPDVISEGPRYNFIPYDYGPFDANVYSDIDGLAKSGEVVVAQSGIGRWNTFSASDQGLVRGKLILTQVSHRDRKYITDVSEWVRAQSFSGLVKSIYNAYPQMKVNSIFRG